MQQKSELPEGWIEVSLDDISIKITDGEHITPKRTENGYHLLSARNIQNGYLDFKNVDYVPKEEYLRIRNRCNPEEGDILISCSGSVGRICSVPKNSEFVMVRSVALVKLSSKLKLNRFFEYQLQSPSLQSQIEKGKKATAQANLFLGPISNLKVALCSLPEQHRIVSAIEALFVSLDATSEKLDSVLGILKKFRQSVLAAACDGRLTEDWRGKSIGLGSEVNDLKDNQNRLHPIPNSWKWVSLEEILRDKDSLSYGILKPGEYDPNGIQMVRVLDIGEYGINSTEIFKVSREIADRYKRTVLESGDILLAIMATVGRTIVVPQEFAGYNVNRALAVIKLNKENNSTYICNVLRSPSFQEKFASEKIGSAQKRINLKDLRLFPLPLPPLPEQQEIVQRVDALFAFADSIEAKVAAAREKTEKLRQSTLAKAFSGQLVETEAEIARKEGRNYETAEGLLERIKEERKKSGKNDKSHNVIKQ